VVVLESPDELLMLVMSVWGIVVVSMSNFAIAMIIVVAVVKSIDFLKSLLEPFSGFIHGGSESFSFGIKE
jgi:hypothetical protein